MYFVLYRFVFTQCCLAALTALTELCVVCCTCLCSQCSLTALKALTELCIVCCTGLCSHNATLHHLKSRVFCVVLVCVHSAALQHLQSCLLCVVPVCVHTVLPYSALCCLLYRFVFTQCCLTSLTGITVLRTAKAIRYRHKLCVLSPYKCKCRPQHYKSFRVFCEVEQTHAQTGDAPCQLNRSFAHDAVLK